MAAGQDIATERFYQALPTVTREAAETQLATVQGTDLVVLLLGMSALEDWQWVQETYFRYARHEDGEVANAAVLGFGHLARISRKVDTGRIEAFLTDLASRNPELQGTIGDAMNDIQIFMRGD